jgi:alcohol dehydrogenase class IV
MFNSEQQFWFGAAGSQDFLNSILKKKAISRIFLVCGMNSCQASGAQAWIAEPLSSAEVVRFSDFSENTDVDDLKRALTVFRQADFDAVMAIGGGSALDLAKLTAFFAAGGVDIDSYLDAPRKISLEKKFMIAVPTTAGTGSEATHFAVLYRHKVKYSVADDAILPDAVIVNPDLTISMPPYLTASTGMDALAQAIESYWAAAATEESKKFAKEAIQLSLRYLERAVNRPDNESRRGMAKAAYLAGCAINISKTTLCHALSYTMTSYYGYPHGHAVSLFLTEIIRRHTQQGALDNDFFELFKGEDPAAVVDDLINKIGLGVRASIDGDGVENIVSRINPERLKNNPVRFTVPELEEIVENSLKK